MTDAAPCHRCLGSGSYEGDDCRCCSGTGTAAPGPSTERSVDTSQFTAHARSLKEGK